MQVKSRTRMRRLAAPILCALAVGVPTAVAGADPGPATAAAAPSVAAAAPGCDPNYAGGCVPVGAAAITCADLAPTTDLLVVGDDVYGLDAGGAGRVACEASGADTPVALPAVTAAPDLAAPAPAPDVAVPAPDAAAVAGATASAPAELARTGRTTLPLLAVSLTLLTLGGALVMATRPRPELLWHGALRRGDVRFTVESVER